MPITPNPNPYLLWGRMVKPKGLYEFTEGWGLGCWSKDFQGLNGICELCKQFEDISIWRDEHWILTIPFPIPASDIFDNALWWAAQIPIKEIL